MPYMGQNPCQCQGFDSSIVNPLFFTPHSLAARGGLCLYCPCFRPFYAKTTAKRGMMRKIIIKHVVLVATSVLLVSFAAVSVHGQEAKQMYEATCAACHGVSGKGDGPAGQALQPKPVDFTTALKGKDEAYLTKVITEGGTGVGKSPMMPAYQDVFSDEQIQGLIQYVKGFASP